MNRSGSVWQLLILLLFVLQIPLSISCTHEPEDLFLSDTICFDTQVLPLLQTSCGMTGCHDGSGEAEGFRLAGYESIIGLVVPGEPKKSKLYKVTTDLWSEHFMPPDNPLSETQRNIIQVWILQGAENTTCNPDLSGPEPPVNIDYGDSVCFVQDILPIFLSSCGTTGCHDAVTHSEGYQFTDYTSVTSRGLIPYNAGSSKIMEVITENESDDRMPPPPREPLSSEQINLLQTWINEGAMNSNCPDAICDTSGTISFSTQVFPILQNYCVSCHNSSFANGGIMLNNYTNTRTAAETERSGTSLLIGATTYG
jgi:hypothetical protein